MNDSGENKSNREYTQGFSKAELEADIFPHLDSSWTLFLDRDGVINRRLIGDYVKSLDEFDWLPGAAQAIASFANLFGRVVVVTNQQGIGKKLMTEGDLTVIHHHLKSRVESLGGSIDSIYHAPQLAQEGSSMRKPEIGMALQAQRDFPEIDFTRSILIGDSPSDMEFGSRAGMISLFLKEDGQSDYPYTVQSLEAFDEVLKRARNIS